MYDKAITTASGGGILAVTGFQTLWLVVTAATLVFAGIALIKLVPMPVKE